MGRHSPVTFDAQCPSNAVRATIQTHQRPRASKVSCNAFCMHSVHPDAKGNRKRVMDAVLRSRPALVLQPSPHRRRQG
eukprot:15259439-Alexandrium_andersonii.AAC.1